MKEDNLPYGLKVVLLGGNGVGVGKSHFLKKILAPFSTTLTSSTQSVVRVSDKVPYNGKSISLQFCDLPDKENFRFDSYLPESHIIFLFYDTTQNANLEESLRDRIAKINKLCPKNCIKILVGNEFGKENSVAEKEARELALINGFHAAYRINLNNEGAEKRLINLALQHYYKDPSLAEQDNLKSVSSKKELKRLKFFAVITKRLKIYEDSPHKFFGFAGRNPSRSTTVRAIQQLIQAYKNETRTIEDIVKELTNLRHSTLQNHQANSFAGRWGLTGSQLATIIQQTINDIARHDLCKWDDLRDYQKNYQTNSASGMRLNQK